ncbi:MAG TPA: hypothetical protein VIC57_13820 [Candidatus Dormibacteraeota bacterium]
MDRIELQERAIGAPALSTVGPAPAIAWTGIDRTGRVHLASGAHLARPDGVTLLDETSRGGPALAADGPLSFLAWTGTDAAGRLVVASSPDGWRNYGKTTAGVESSRQAPALVCGEGWLFLAWTGPDARLNVASSNSAGESFPYQITLDERSDAGPSLAFHGDTLYLLWTGTDLRLNVASTRDHHGLTLGRKVTLDERSRFAPALTSTDRHLLVWTGMDGGLRAFESADVRTFGERRMLGATSLAGPAVSAWRGVPVVAWTAEDGWLNVASLSEAPLPLGAGPVAATP